MSAEPPARPMPTPPGAHPGQPSKSSSVIVQPTSRPPGSKPQPATNTQRTSLILFVLTFSAVSSV